MKNKKLIVFLLILTFGIIFNSYSVSAATQTTYIYKTNQQSYTNGTQTWYAHQFYTANKASIANYNAYCTYPKATSWNGSDAKSITATEVTNNSDFKYINSLLYYGYGGPGWGTSAGSVVKEKYDVDGGLCKEIYESSCSNSQYYLLTHLVLAYYSILDLPSSWYLPTSSDIDYGLKGREYYIISNGPFDVRSNLPTVTDNKFHVWYYEGSSGYQNFIYWTYDEPEETKYCTSVTKTDASGNTITGATFSLYSGSSCSGTALSSKTGGTAIFTNLASGTYSVKETAAPDGYFLNSTCHSATLSQMSGSSCTATSLKIANDRKYCLKVRKADSVTNEEITRGTKFQLFTDSSCTNAIGAPKDAPATYTNLAEKNLYVKEVVEPTGYSGDTRCISVTAVEQTGSTCNISESSIAEIKDRPLYLSFYKEKEDGTPLTTAQFKIRSKDHPDDRTSFITVSARDSRYNNCYVYTGTSSAGTLLTPDSNGRVCVVKIPEGTYTAEEQATGDNKYYLDNLELITNLQTSTSITAKSTSNKLINKPYLINFFKVNEASTTDVNLPATFKIKNASGTYIKVSGTTSAVSGYSGCYIYSGEATSASDASTLTAATSDSGDIKKGEVCVIRVPGNTTYTAVEQSTGNSAYYVANSETTGIAVSTSRKTFANAKKIINKPYVLNFYKVTENETTKVGGAEFVITNSSGNYITATGPATTSGYLGCYIYSGTTSNKSSATRFVSSSNNVTNGVSIGEVCVIRVPNGSYKVTETKAPEYHTFGSVVTKTLSTSENRNSISTSNKFINYKTEFKFTKEVSEEIGYDDIWKNMTTEELQKIPFVIYDSNGNAVEVIKTATGVYEYAGNNVDATSGTRTTKLYLDSNRNFVVYHLPKGTYTIKEDECCCEDTCTNPSSTNCYGFYSPDYSKKTTSSYTFTIDDCSTSNTTGTDENGNRVCSHKAATSTLDNTPTEVKFTKSDFYSYADPHETVKFEDDEEISAFDNITFKVYYKDSNGNKVYVRFAKVNNIGTCKTEDSYSEYRYIPDTTSTNIMNQINANYEVTEEIHTCGGHIRITHLCRGRKYYIEEVSVPENTVFTLPETEEARTRELDLSCCIDEDGDKPSTTTVIEDKPTRVILQKRDSKYGYLIPDETTTFKLYRCSTNTNCHPGDYVSDEERKAAGIDVVKFYDRAVIPGDEEDSSKEVYRAILNTAKVDDYVTELHPYYGELILRYLQSGYDYVLLETVSPKNYVLPRGRNAETKIVISTSTVDVEEVDVVNKPTSLLLKKYADDGELLEGAEFRIYEGTTCDKNLSAYAQPKTKLSFKTISDGIYEYRNTTDTDIVKTCTDTVDGKCNGMTSSLTFDDYVDTWANFTNSVNQEEERVEINAGEALIQYLEYGHCYIIEEVKAPKGYSLPEKVEDRFIMVTIEEESDVVDTYKELINKPTPYTFYKFNHKDELIDGGEFELQKLNSDKIYETVTVSEYIPKNIEEDKIDRKYYKVDENSNNTKIETKNGTATIYFLEEGQYRIIETKAPEGMELPSKQINVATFYVDSKGNVTGSSIITNKPKTEKIEVKPKASSELIVNISTGNQVVRYGLIIGVIVLSIFGLIYVQNKGKKK